MFSVEPNAFEASQKLYEAEERYEDRFGKVFPTYEYGDTLKGNGYDHSRKGMEKLAAFINKRIEDNKPVPIPKGYEERVY
ncbi:hypothetical protein [Enterococcus saccharolyticus]|uniref:hypothetical protein n=1 Tax=Enterococcus saccharolyticus TaxID=41997 RepID=UPI0039DF6DA1